MAYFIEHCRLSYRVVTRDRHFTLLMVVSLALGSGICGTFFSIVDPLFVRALPFSQPTRLVSLLTGTQRATVSGNDLRGLAQVFDGKLGVAHWNFARSLVIIETASPTEVSVLPVSSNFLDVLGINPHIGTGLAPDGADEHPRILITFGFWQQHLGGAPSVLGNKVVTDEAVFEIAGVLPRSFLFPTPLAQRVSAIYVDSVPQLGGNDRRFVVARLPSGTTIEVAQQRLDALFVNSADPSNAVSSTGLRFVTLRQTMFPLTAQVVALLFIGSLLTLFLASMNAAVLMGTRSLVRRQELAIKRSLGASRSRLALDLTIEAVLFGLLGASLGCALSYILLDVTRQAAPIPIFRLESIGIDIRTVLFVAMASISAGLLAICFAAGPAYARLPLGVSARNRAGPKVGRQLKVMVGLQAGLGIVVLAFASSNVRTFAELRLTNLGFDPSEVTTYDPRVPTVYQAPEMLIFHRQLVDAVAQFPGVRSAAGIDVLPMTRARPENSFRAGPDGRVVGVYQVTSEYFRTLGIELAEGRLFTKTDDERGGEVVIANRAAVPLLGLTSPTIGSVVALDHDQTQPRLVGVVSDTRPSFDQPSEPAVYVPFTPGSFRRMTIVVKSVPATDSFGYVVARATQFDPGILIRSVSLSELVGRSAAYERLQAFAFSLFGALTLLLVASGLFSTCRYLASLRTREFAIRSAIGAQQRHVRILLLTEILVPVCSGLTVGGVAATTILPNWFLARLVPSTTTAPSLLAIVACGLGLTLLATCVGILAVRSAVFRSPMSCLRQE